MFVNKKKTPAKIFCRNGILVKGFVHLNEGERVQDFANDPKKSFVPVTKVELYYAQWPEMKKVESSLIALKDVIMLNKSSIIWIEESSEHEQEEQK
jgi:hypothetical protein